MLIGVRQLLNRVRGGRERADELARLLSRMAEEPSFPELSPEMRETAGELRRLREELSRALSGVVSCGSCAAGYPLPYGRFDGGHCCGGRTEVLFTADELAALKASGTSPARLRPPSSELAGCVFRGDTGCSLEPSDRPNLCVRYTCRGLEAELDQRGERRRIVALQEQLGAAYEKWVSLRAEAAARKELEEWFRFGSRADAPGDGSRSPSSGSARPSEESRRRPDRETVRTAGRADR